MSDCSAAVVTLAPPLACSPVCWRGSGAAPPDAGCSTAVLALNLSAAAVLQLCRNDETVCGEVQKQVRGIKDDIETLSWHMLKSSFVSYPA